MKSKISKTGLEPYQIIIESVCKSLSISKDALELKKVTTETKEARYIIFKLLRDKGLKYRVIGELFNRTAHDVMYGIDVYGELMASRDKAFLAKIALVKSELEGKCELA